VPGWSLDALKFAGLSIGLFFAISFVYVSLLNVAMRAYVLWRVRAPARRRGRARIRALAHEYETTGHLDPELQQVFDEVAEMG
jgi:hypothetical protein